MGRTGGFTPPHRIPGQPLLLRRTSRRTLESWANHYGFKHLADELPLNKRAEFYKTRLYELQRSGQGPLYGQPMKRLPMAQSDWPNRKYKGKMKALKEQQERESAGTSDGKPKNKRLREEKRRVARLKKPEKPKKSA
ncbi:hypothetical protein FB45DRAFT_795022 [Roridomyces roridus]|uniref:Uncharacterized protein n=1 Tax=Roridomyces roridus TaxID=1738132 RepID=A0AAD7FKC8_9AGAR|nr:hypothetical protein FB45DRAFT_795022 [Roridomyces roridus]